MSSARERCILEYNHAKLALEDDEAVRVENRTKREISVHVPDIRKISVN